MFEKIWNLFHTYARLVGVEMYYNWIPIKTIALWFTVGQIMYTWGSVCKTHVIHFNNGDTLRIIEPFSLYGLASSVNY